MQHRHCFTEEHRHCFTAAPPHQVNAAPPKAPANGEHPPALRNFVMRFFARGSVSVRNARCTIAAHQHPQEAEKDALRKLIADAKDKGELWSRDWDNTPLPTVNSVATAAAAPTITAMPAPRPAFTLRATGPKGGALGGGALAKSKAQAAAAALSSQLKRHRVDIGPQSPPLMSKKKAKKAAAALAKQQRLLQVAQAKALQHVSDDEAPVDQREVERRQRRAGRFGDGATEDFSSNRTKALRAAAVHEARCVCEEPFVRPKPIQRTITACVQQRPCT